MAKLAIIAAPTGDPEHDKDVLNNSPHVMQWKKIGRHHTPQSVEYYVADVLLHNSFIFESEATAENPATNLPNDWVVAHGVQIHNRGVTTYTYEDLAPIVIPAQDITDDTFTHTHHYRLTKAVYDDSEIPVLLGVNLFEWPDRPIPESVVDDVPNYLFTEGTLNSNGSWTYTTPAKLVTHVGSGKTLKVDPGALEDDGTYIYQRQSATVAQPAYELLHPEHPQLIEWARDNPDGQRPDEFLEEFTYGRMEPGRFQAT
jgi:hypothetical protein